MPVSKDRIESHRKCFNVVEERHGLYCSGESRSYALYEPDLSWHVGSPNTVGQVV